MNIELLNRDVLEAVRQNLGCEEPDDDSLDERISQMGPWELFRRYLEWEGIIGYSRRIWDSVESIKLATAKEEDL